MTRSSKPQISTLVVFVECRESPPFPKHPVLMHTLDNQCFRKSLHLNRLLHPVRTPTLDNQCLHLNRLPHPVRTHTLDNQCLQTSLQLYRYVTFHSPQWPVIGVSRHGWAEVPTDGAYPATTEPEWLRWCWHHQHSRARERQHQVPGRRFHPRSASALPQTHAGRSAVWRCACLLHAVSFYVVLFSVLERCFYILCCLFVACSVVLYRAILRSRASFLYIVLPVCCMQCCFM